MFLGIIIFDLGTLSVERAHSIYSVSKRVLSCFELWQEAIIHRGQGVFCDHVIIISDIPASWSTL